MSDPSKHHYIPVFYLKQWATDGFLCEMRKVWGKVVAHSKAPDGTGYQKDLYKIDGVPAELAQHFERSFMQMVDTQAANGIRRLESVSREQWNARERDAWVRFILSLIFRNPEAVALVKDQIKRLWAEGINSIRENYDAQRQPGDPATFDEFLAKTDPHAPALAASNFLQQMMNSEPVANGIMDLKWGRVNFPHSRHTLLTSDRPLGMPYGLGMQESYIVLPIGPRMIFTATNEPLKLSGLSPARQTAMVREINECTVRQARQYVWGVDDSALSFVTKYICTQPDRRLISDRTKELAEKHARGAT
ncbi:DUF4238 domain-containing protein [Bradyrhizobium diazoefficiens]|uniref:DUF4238 domain-containing protein n=1 Tax=Bradyrhizobium diazoefficiens TaxID=1355477 RepID=A0A810CSU3_9BRAD|nr:DUF4238 domain-containing protein [Bradyrhizobium diazoefficiens]WLA70024.1 DUF4238 domain-containing protein [Bradyrhizobium diazoefficiens]BCE22377.1 hypothetical protein XF1B_50580 [Bradyrhizobium diazoefficiens]BCE48641.1 hypothetical protein XF4B_49900 [Bradyrhizobium diazoefficiens]BCE92156.1 hypothetical protein XF10B_49540 [Bradyrhizobium diazoefficiens]BCF27083.1 hypothetical protein XF14B_50350 [Bradyrhizobium diazoefficiens]